MAKTKKLAGTPSVLAFARRIDPSDACMYRTSWGDRSKMEKLEVKTKTMRTVLSNRLKKKEADNETGNALKESDPSEWQIHRSEYCTLGPDADTLVVRFTVKFLGGLSPYACNIPEYAETVGERIRDYMDGSTDTTGIGDLGLRYARNIAAASFLWRNRIGAENIKTEVVDVTEGAGGEMLIFDSLETPYDFSEKVDPSSALGILGRKIAETLKDCSEDKHLLLEVTSYVRLGFGREVYPSQEMVENASKTDVSRFLHSVDGAAALTSQKVGNAIRRIDTWYDDYAEFGQPLSVEVYGTSSSFGRAFRRDRETGCFYDLYDRWVAGEEISPSEKDYVIAMLIRGGVFGEK